MHSISPQQKAIFLDFDGTLVNFADKPELVDVSHDLRALLAQLYNAYGGAVALVSGRSIDSLDKLLQTAELPVAGGHGAEWRLPGGERHSVVLDSDNFALAVKRLTGFALARNLLTETKPHSFALHFRQQSHYQAEIDQFIADNIACLNDLRTIYGNCVREIQPKGVDKGVAVARLMELSPFVGRTPCYFGDDTTDEDAFRWVNAHQGETYKVGPGDSCAKFRLPDVQAVMRHLQHLLATASG